MTPREIEEYRALRDTIRERGTARIWVFLAGLVAWGALTTATAALAALPAEFEGTHRKHMLVRGGERRDSAWYAVTDEEWPAVETHLLDRLSRSR